MNPTLRTGIAVSLAVFGLCGFFWLGTATEQADPCEEVRAAMDQLVDAVPTTTTTGPRAWNGASGSSSQAIQEADAWQFGIEKAAQVVSNNPECFPAYAVASTDAWLSRLNSQPQQ